MDTRSTTALPPRFYQDFEPPSEWIEGFRKEQMKVQIDSERNLQTSGERPLDGNNNRWSRFSKAIRIPETLNLTGIRAKFENGILHVTIPKLIVNQPAPAPTEVPANQKAYWAPTPALAPQQNGKAKVSEPAETNEKEKDGPKENFADRVDEKESPANEHWVSSGSGGGATGLKRQREKVLNGAERTRQLLMNASMRQLLLNIAVAILLLVGVGVYVSYMVKRDNWRVHRCSSPMMNTIDENAFSPLSQSLLSPPATKSSSGA